MISVLTSLESQLQYCVTTAIKEYCMSAFEIISADEFKSAQTAQFEKASPPAEGRSLRTAGGTPFSDGTGGEELKQSVAPIRGRPSDPVVGLNDAALARPEGVTEYCDFCKGYYIAEYHVSRGGE